MLVQMLRIKLLWELGRESGERAVVAYWATNTNYEHESNGQSVDQSIHAGEGGPAELFKHTWGGGCLGRDGCPHLSYT